MSWFQRLNCAIFGHRWGTCNAVCDACGAENPRLTKIRREHGDGPGLRADGGQPASGSERFLDLNLDDDPHLGHLDGARVESAENVVSDTWVVEADGERVLVAGHEIEEKEVATDGGADRFDESHNLKYGVVKDSIPEEDIYRHDENPVIIYQFDEDGPYKLSVGSRVGQDTKIFFDSVYWHAGEYQGTLWFEREVGDETITTGNIDWHAAHPTHKLGLVGEWFFERIDLEEYRAGVECPECDGEVLHLPMTSACDNPECDFSCEGHYGHAAAAVHSLAEYDGEEADDESMPQCAHCGRSVREEDAAPGPAGHAVHEECDADE